MLSEHFHQAGVHLERREPTPPPAGLGRRQSDSSGPGCPPPKPLVFPLLPRGQPLSQRPIPTWPLLSYSVLVQMHSQADSSSPSRAPTWKRKRGRCPQAGLTMTRCETSGYNTGPGRCSDPSCLVLQPEGRRSAAEPAPRQGPDVAAARRRREGRWV